jgi:hypothetical protein
MRLVLSIVLFVVLGVCIGGPALDPEFQLPVQYFDGDDSGHVGEIFTVWVGASATDTLTFVPSVAPIRHLAPCEVPRPQQTEPLCSRAPPA